jgi:hypothetical protein
MAIKYYCSDGSRVSQTTIDKRRSDTYKRLYYGESPRCKGCGTRATCSAHIIAQARCKVLHLTELCWNPINIFPACYKCNAAIENPKGSDWKELLNIEECLEVIKKYDLELYNKFINEM